MNNLDEFELVVPVAVTCAENWILYVPGFEITIVSFAINPVVVRDM